MQKPLHTVYVVKTGLMSCLNVCRKCVTEVLHEFSAHGHEAKVRRSEEPETCENCDSPCEAETDGEFEL